MKKTLSLLLALLLIASAPAFTVRAEKGDAVLLDLKVDEISLQTELEPAFAPEVHDYRFTVQSDIYGVRVTPVVEEGVPVFVNDQELAEGEGLVVELSQEIEDYDEDQEVVVEITVGEDRETVYTVTVLRQNASALYERFDVKEYEDAESGSKMAYLLHLPEDYDEAKTYPLIVALHGSGQMSQSIDMVLKRYELATTWLRQDVEAIVLAPHCADLNADDGAFASNWSTVAGEEPFGLGAAGKIVYKIIQELRAEYAVDLDRQYITGLSMGGWGVYALIVEHPEDWAAALVSSATTWDHDDQVAEKVKEYQIPIWITHAANDPVRNFAEFGKMVNALNAVGADYRVTAYTSEQLFYPSAHFSWTPMYADPVILDWFLTQVRK